MTQGNSTTTVQVQLQSKEKSGPTLNAPYRTTPESVGAAYGNKKKADLAEQTVGKIDLLDEIIPTVSTSKEKVS